MILVGLALTALAAPPRGEVFGGWAGNANGGYGYLTAHQSVARSEQASLFLRGGASHLQYRYFNGLDDVDVDSPGASLGIGFTYVPGALSFSLAASYEARITTHDPWNAAPVRTLESGGVLSSTVFWEPRRRMALFAIGSFSGANAYLWTRIGGLHQVVPRLRRDTPFSLWLGLDGTARGNPDAHAYEAGAVAELRSRDLRASLAVRSGVTFESAGDRDFLQGTVGVAAYWWY